MQFNTQYKRWKQKAEEQSVESKVEKTGYVPAKTQIENMIMAGRRLNAYRAEQYDFTGEENDEEEDNFEDPTRSPNFDIADASSIQKVLERKFKSARNDGVERRRVRDTGSDSLRPEGKLSEGEKNKSEGSEGIE